MMYESISTTLLWAMFLIGCYAQSSTETPEPSVTANSFAGNQPNGFPQRQQSIDFGNQINGFEPPRQYISIDRRYMPLLFGLIRNMGIPFPVFQPPYRFPGMMNDTLNRVMNPFYTPHSPQYAFYPGVGMTPMGQRVSLPLAAVTGMNPISHLAAPYRNIPQNEAHILPMPPHANPMENIIYYNALREMSRYYDREPVQAILESSTDDVRSEEPIARKDGPRPYIGQMPLFPLSVSMQLPYASGLTPVLSNLNLDPEGFPPSEESPQENVETEAPEQSNKPYMFGFESNDGNGTDQHRHEESDGKTVRGHYGYTGPDGRTRLVLYKADGNGFVARVNTNEPGMANPGSANVEVHAEQPPMETILEGLKSIRKVTVKVDDGSEQDIVLSDAK